MSKTTLTKKVLSQKGSGVGNEARKASLLMLPDMGSLWRMIYKAHLVFTLLLS